MSSTDVTMSSELPVVPPSVPSVSNNDMNNDINNEESKPKRRRVPVKEKKAKKPLTEARQKQLAEARASHSKKAAERRKAKQSDPTTSSSSSSRLVKDDGEAAKRYLDTLKSVNPDVTIAESESKSSSSKKRKPKEQGGRDSKVSDEVDLGSAAMTGLGLLAAAGVAYVAGKNLTSTATNSGFTGHGSAIMGNPSQGIPAIPIQNVLSPEMPRFNTPITITNGRPGVPSLGYFS